MPEPVRRAHGKGTRYTAVGTSTVTPARNPLARLTAWLFSFPDPGDNVPVHLTVIREDGREIWVRRFGARQFASTHDRGGDEKPRAVTERFGPLAFHLDVTRRDERILVTSRGMHAFGIPVPRIVMPTVQAEEWAECDRFCFDVDIRLPVLGRLVRYRGKLTGTTDNDLAPQPDSVDSNMKPDAILLFDGMCNLCCGSMAFYAKRDLSGSVRYCAIQSDTGRALLARHGRDPDDFSHMVLIENGQVHAGAAAVLRLVRRMTFPWNLFGVFVVLPKPLQNAIYSLVARTRYRLFGRRSMCRVPVPALRSRFIA